MLEQVYGASSTQDAIYDGTARDIVDAAFDGYNGERLQAGVVASKPCSASAKHHA